MPIFTFAYPPQQCKAGCVERIVVNGGFTKVVKHPQTGQPCRVPDPVAAWKWVTQHDLPFPGGNVVPGVEGSVETPKIVAIQITQPTVSANHVGAAAPYGPPVGNGGMAPPPLPQATPGRQGQVDFEPINPAGLPSTSDSFLDADPTGGTFTDIDGQGNETVRNNDNPIMPISPRRQG